MIYELKISLLASAIAACLGTVAAAQPTEPPEWLRVMSETAFDRQEDDLVTAGFGVARMAEGPQISFADSLNPTAKELRRVSLLTNGTAGFGTIWGPTVDATTGEERSGDGKVAGTEYLAYANDGQGLQNAAFLLQVPKGFDSSQACILAVPVGGSASLYRNVGNLGYWGLQKNCAVVYTDKGLVPWGWPPTGCAWGSDRPADFSGAAPPYCIL